MEKIMDIDWHDVQESIREKIVDLLLWSLKCVKPYKDQLFSQRLHNIADHYARRPSGLWER